MRPARERGRVQEDAHTEDAAGHHQHPITMAETAGPLASPDRRGRPRSRPVPGGRTGHRGGRPACHRLVEAMGPSPERARVGREGSVVTETHGAALRRLGGAGGAASAGEQYTASRTSEEMRHRRFSHFGRQWMQRPQLREWPREVGWWHGWLPKGARPARSSRGPGPFRSCPIIPERSETRPDQALHELVLRRREAIAVSYVHVAELEAAAQELQHAS